MNEQDLRERYRTLAQEKLPDEARRRIRGALREGQGAAERSGSGRGGSAWWIAAAAVAAGLLALALLSHSPDTSKPAHHPTKRTLLAVKTPFASIDMLTATSGWAVGGKGQIARTTDGGGTWQLVTPPGMPQGAPNSVLVRLAATDPSHAWIAVAAMGSNFRPPVTVYYTSDGGAAWQRAATGQSGWPQMRFLTNSTGFLLLHEGVAAGSEGVLLLATSDGGAHWTVVANGQPTAQNTSIIFGGDKSGFGFLDAQHGWLTGNWAANSILLYVTADGGKTWTRPTLPLPPGLNADGGSAQSEPPYFFGTQDGVLPVEFFHPGQPIVFYRTADGGKTWRPTTPLDGGGNQPVYSVVSQSVIVASDGAKIYLSTDGGQNWASLQPNVSLAGLTQIDFTSATRGWALVKGRLLGTADGGKTWTQLGTGK